VRQSARAVPARHPGDPTDAGSGASAADAVIDRDLTDILVTALIGHRAARAVAMDDIGEPIRRWSRDYSAGDPQSRHRRMLVGLFKCPHCIGFWQTMGIGLIVISPQRKMRKLALIAAATGLQSLFATYSQEDQVAMEWKPPDSETPSEEGESDVVPPEGLIPSE
jgi:Protein of unknown function (DUF1360)